MGSSMLLGLGCLGRMKTVSPVVAGPDGQEPCRRAPSQRNTPRRYSSVAPEEVRVFFTPRHRVHRASNLGPTGRTATGRSTIHGLSKLIVPIRNGTTL